MYKPKTEFILCGDLNINFLERNNNQTHFQNLRNTFNLIGTVHFPTRITNTSIKAIDNIFLDDRNYYYTIKPHINGLSDHHAQILKLKIGKFTYIDGLNGIVYTRNINELSIMEFKYLLSWELWEDVFSTSDVNIMFSNFLNTYLRCIFSSFVKKKNDVLKQTRPSNEWISKGIKVSCRRKKELYEISRSSNDLAIKLYYKKYCTILTKLIHNAKKSYYNNVILKSKNRMKSIRKIINSEKGRNQQHGTASSLTLDSRTITDSDTIANIFNNYFTSVADNINIAKNNAPNTNKINPIEYLHKFYGDHITKLKWKSAITHEIEKII